MDTITFMTDLKPVSFDDTSVAFSSKSDKELERMHLLFSTMNWKYPTKIGTFFIKTALKLKLPVRAAIKNSLFKQFCGGETLEECKPAIYDLMRFNIKTILDFSVEAGKTDVNFDCTTDKILETIDISAISEAVPFAVFKMTGIGPAALLEKVETGEPLTETEMRDFELIEERAEKICRRAFEKNVRVLVDAEESWLQGTTDAIVYELMKKYNKERAIVFNTFQMYRADMQYNLERALETAVADKFILGVKLVRGAYLEKERKWAEARNFPSPVFETKEETDAAFDHALNYCIRNIDNLELCSGTHNERSNFLLTQLMQRAKIARNDPRIYFAQLYGMSDNISYNLANAGFNVAKYLPFGPVKLVMPYLFRRAQENQAVTGQSSRELELIKKELHRRKGIS